MLRASPAGLIASLDFYFFKDCKKAGGRKISRYLAAAANDQDGGIKDWLPGKLWPAQMRVDLRLELSISCLTQSYIGDDFVIRFDEKTVRYSKWHFFQHIL